MDYGPGELLWRRYLVDDKDIASHFTCPCSFPLIHEVTWTQLPIMFHALRVVPCLLLLEAMVQPGCETPQKAVSTQATCVLLVTECRRDQMSVKDHSQIGASELVRRWLSGIQPACDFPETEQVDIRDARGATTGAPCRGNIRNPCHVCADPWLQESIQGPSRTSLVTRPSMNLDSMILRNRRSRAPMNMIRK